MAKGLIGGMTDYSHQSFKDIINDLERDEKNANAFIKAIETNLQKVDKSGYWNKKVIFNFQSIIHYSIKSYKTAAEEFQLIREEIQEEVKENHCTRLRRIASVADEINRDIGKIWHREYHGKEYGNSDFEIVERIYGDTRDMAVNLLDCSNVAERLSDFVGRKAAKKNSNGNNDEGFQIYSKWWLMSIIVFLIASVIVYLLIENFKFSIILGLLAGVITLFKNPRRRFNTMFWSVFGIFASVNYFSINFIVNYLRKTEESNLDIHFSFKEPSVIISVLLIPLMGYLAYLDYKEGKK